MEIAGLQGKGIMTCGTGLRYEGEWRQNTSGGIFGSHSISKRFYFVNRGTYTRGDGIKYDGEFNFGKPSGDGILYNRDGTIMYKGKSWVDGASCLSQVGLYERQRSKDTAQ